MTAAGGFDAMNVYLIQFDIVWEDRSANHAQVRQLLMDAQPEPDSLLILPELFATGFSMAADRAVQTENREDEQFCRELASHWNCVVVAGVATRHAESLPRNEAVVFAPDGGELLRYAKQQPFTLAGENAAYGSGENTGVFSWQGFKIAPLICYDLRFPEHFRSAIDQDAEILIVIASWPARRQRHWDVLLQARAIENQAYVIGVNRCGTDPKAEYAGGSLVCDPMGVTIAHGGTGPGVIGVWLDQTHLRQWREKFPALLDRKIKTPM